METGLVEMEGGREEVNLGADRHSGVVKTPAIMTQITSVEWLGDPDLSLHLMPLASRSLLGAIHALVPRFPQRMKLTCWTDPDERKLSQTMREWNMMPRI